jgi:hypothetical protein
MQSQECAERKILQGRERADRRIYVSMVAELNNPLSTKDFREAYARAERARLAYEDARDALEVHIEVHGCGEPV